MLGIVHILYSGISFKTILTKTIYHHYMVLIHQALRTSTMKTKERKQMRFRQIS